MQRLLIGWFLTLDDHLAILRQNFCLLHELLLTHKPIVKIRQNFSLLPVIICLTLSGTLLRILCRFFDNLWLFEDLIWLLVS